MKEKKGNKAANNHSKYRPLKKGVLNKNTEKSQKKEINHEDDQQKINSGNSHKHEFTINIPDKEDKWTKANVISFIIGIITFCYFISTIFLLIETRKSAKIADATFNEVKKEFEISNKPFLQIDSVALDSPIIGSPLRIRYNLVNIKPVAVKIIETMTGTVMDSIDKSYMDTSIITYLKRTPRTDNRITKFNEYIIKEFPKKMLCTTYFDLSKARLDSLVNGGGYLYVISIVKYANIEYSKVRYYTFEIKIKPINGHLYWAFLKNDNVDSLVLTQPD